MTWPTKLWASPRFSHRLCEEGNTIAAIQFLSFHVEHGARRFASPAPPRSASPLPSVPGRSFIPCNFADPLRKDPDHEEETKKNGIILQHNNSVRSRTLIDVTPAATSMCVGTAMEHSASSPCSQRRCNTVGLIEALAGRSEAS